MTARFLVGDVFNRLAEIDDASIDLVVTSPPFLALRSYLPADHPDKGKEIGSESTPAEFIDVMLRVTQELRRVLAPHGSIAVELGDTYAGSGGAGGDYGDNGLRDGQPKFKANPGRNNGIRYQKDGMPSIPAREHQDGLPKAGPGWPLSKSLSMIPESYRWALVYGMNPFTGEPSPAGQWRVRNLVDWVRPNPPVGALGDKWRPATSDLVIACTSPKRYWDDLATRHVNPRVNEASRTRAQMNRGGVGYHTGESADNAAQNPAGAPLLDWWEIPPTGYSGSHYAVFPPALVEPCVKAMCPPRVCRECGEPSRRIVSKSTAPKGSRWGGGTDPGPDGTQLIRAGSSFATAQVETVGWSDCGHGDWRPGLVLDPFAGSGTTLLVATGHGYDAIGIDLDERNAELGLERVGPFLMEVVA